jgi:hypothetical protein
MPIFSNAVHISQPSGPLASFEVFNVVPIGIDPLKDVVIIPYAKHVLKRYEKIIERLQTLLLELIDNRILCIKGNIPGLIPVNSKYPEDLFSSQERELMKQKIDNFYITHPIENINTKFQHHIRDLEKIRWYLEEDV